jgi:hypothetical protein
MNAIKRLLREPLLHFLLLGAGLFLAYSLMPRNGSGETGKIVVSEGQVENMVAGFAKTWQRPPTTQELAGLLNDHVREEVYYREALALGLDKDDTVIRRRLRQKMEFVSEDIVAQAQPTDDELNAYLQAHADAFRTQPMFTFSQVYLDPQKHGEHLARDAAQLLAQLNQTGSKADPMALGDALMLEHSYAGVAGSEVASQFGDKFAATLGGLAIGQWQGPIASGYGAHLVRVSERTESTLPALAEVRDAVLREWTNARRLETNEKFFQELLRHYTVTIEQPKPVEERKKVAAAQ